MTAQNWFNAERVSQPGSVILNSWVAQRQAERGNIKAATVSGSSSGSEMYDILTGGLNGSAGMSVSAQSAMTVSAVYASVGLIGGAIASMPFHIFKRTAQGRERYDSDLWWMFNESPWTNWTAASAWSHAAQSIALRGDGFWRIHRASTYSNVITGFEPLHPTRVQVHRENLQTSYIVVNELGEIETIDPADMLHFPGIGFDGVRSLTPITAALRPSVGIALAADEYAGAFFKNGARPDFALTTTGTLTKEQADLLRNTWGARHSGASNAHLPAVLAGGLDVKQLTMSAEDAQLLSTRKFQIEDIARIFGVPPHMIGHSEKNTSWGTGVEQMSISFVRYTLHRYMDSMRQEINRKVWPKNRQVYAEHDPDALMSGDSGSQATYFGKALGGPGTQGWMTPNEVRRLKNLPPVAGGNKLAQPGAPAPSSDTEDDHTDPAEPAEPAQT